MTRFAYMEVAQRRSGCRGAEVLLVSRFQRTRYAKAAKVLVIAMTDTV